MAIADRKLRAWNERQQLILDHADELLEQHGYLGLNLDELAEKVEYSKATIYNHFKSKEDLMLAVATEHGKKRREFFSRALVFDGRTRERVFVIGVADMVLAKRYSHWFSLMQLVRTQSIWEKAAPETHQTFYSEGAQCMATICEVIRQAKAQGDLGADSPSEGQIVAGLVSMAKGAHLLSEGASIFPPESGIDPLGMLFANYHLFLDGLEWAPLRKDWDYDATQKRIETEVFSVELQGIPLT